MSNTASVTVAIPQSKVLTFCLKLHLYFAEFIWAPLKNKCV